MTLPGSKMSNAPENDSFAVSFIHVELRRDCKRDYVKVGESNVGSVYRIVNKILCFLEGGYASQGSEEEAFQRLC